MNSIFSKKGNIIIGSNFWGSKCGIKMWREWDEKSIENDLKKLSEISCKYLRVFPDWGFFQPIVRIDGYHGMEKGISIDDGNTLLKNDFEDTGINEVAFGYFEKFLQMCEKYDIKVIPSILTGWMSGCLFAPPALVGRNLLTDPFAIKWEIRFVRAFVKRFKKSPAIIAWCIGNECNCMAITETAEASWMWTASIANAIRSIDSREILSGMHSLKADGEGTWTIEDQAENTDILTTHPYGSPTYASDIDPLNTYRPLMHPAIQSLYYKGLGKKQCIIEETGTFGEMYANEEVTADYMRCVLYTVWAYDIRGYFWWISFDQGELTYYPFYRNNRGSNYGLFRKDGSEKPIISVMRNFNKFISEADYKLPDRIVDGLCILSRCQDTWATAYNTFLLSKQAGLDIEFCFADQNLPDVPLYIMPSLNDAECLRKDVLDQLMQRVKSGAVLYISTDDGMIRNLCKDFGLKIISRVRRSGDNTIEFVSNNKEKLNIDGSTEYIIENTTAKTIAKSADGNSVYTVCDYGKGKLFWFTRPIESQLYRKPGLYHKDDAQPLHIIYDEFAKFVNTKKVARINNRFVSMTEHIVSDNERILVCINCSPNKITEKLVLNDGWRTEEEFKKNSITINACDAIVIKINK